MFYEVDNYGRGRKRIEKREHKNEDKNEKSPLEEEKMRNMSNEENMSQSSRSKIFERCGLNDNNDVNVKEDQNICAFALESDNR